MTGLWAICGPFSASRLCSPICRWVTLALLSQEPDFPPVLRGWGCISLSGGTILTFWRVEKKGLSHTEKKNTLRKFRWYWASCFLSHHLTTLLSPCTHNKADTLLAAWIFFFRCNIFYLWQSFVGGFFWLFFFKGNWISWQMQHVKSMHPLLE